MMATVQGGDGMGMGMGMGNGIALASGFADTNRPGQEPNRCCSGF